MDKEFIPFVKGALLHDIGKVIQRASDHPAYKKHTEWGYDWLIEKGFDENIALASLCHHYHPDYTYKSNAALIWYQADNLASGERKEIEDEEFEESEWHRDVLLASPFSRIRNPLNIDEIPELTYLPLIKNLESVEVTLKDETEAPAGTEEYKKLLSDFEKDLEVGRKYGYPFNLLLMLFEKHFSNVPSITSKYYSKVTRQEIKSKHPDISLFDHSKLTAAIAGCMYRYYRETYPDRWNTEMLVDEIKNVPDDHKPYLLIGGDISGIQKFIFTITSKGALKSLKGRSFFLELLTEHCVSELIEKLNLTRCNLIFSGGGHFYILGYNTHSAVKVINELRDRINDLLFKEFEGALQVHIDYEPFHPDLFSKKGTELSELWNVLSEKLEKRKKKKWLLRLEKYLIPQMPYEDKDEEKSCLTRSCEICFREDKPLVDLIEEEEIKVCESCRSQYLLGSMLVRISKKHQPVIYKFKEKPQMDSIKIANHYYTILNDWDENLGKTALSVYRVNDFRPEAYEHSNAIFLPFGIYQHDEMQELSDVKDEFGISRLAVLRMDVDNLGKIFSEAVHPEDRTFSRMASISRRLNEFFKYYLNHIVEGRVIEDAIDVAGRGVKDKRRKLSVVYSGGDDLFIIGHWLDVTEAAIDINRYFRKYTGNPFISISGGIAINHPKYPVYQYARDAERAETIAKENRKNGAKNAITLFGGKDFKWYEINEVLERVDLFLRFLRKDTDHIEVDPEKLPKTFFYRLLSLARRFNEEGVLILPKAAYLISRANFKNAMPDDILKIKEVVMTSSKEQWKITETATLWTLMMMRRGGEE